MRAHIHRGQKGFTLVELLIVVAILGALAAVALPSVSQFIGSGTTEATATELQTVQTAMDLYMAKNKLTAVTAATVAVTDFSASNPVLYPDFLSLKNPSYTNGYTWTTTGKVTQAP